MDERIIARVLDNCSTPDEAEKVAEFLGKDEGQRLLSQIIDKNLKDLEQGVHSCVDNMPAEEIYQHIVRTLKRRKARFVSVCAAAVVAPVLIVAGTLGYVNRMMDGRLFEQTEICKVTVPNGDKIQVVLNDGTTVYLNSGSTMSYPDRFSLKTREVTLEGEGYFKVESNPKRPFVIHVPGSTVKVLGTSFDLCAYPQDQMVTLALDEGKVAMDVKDNTYCVLPGQVLYLNRLDNNVRITSGGAAMKSKWMNGIVTFNSATLGEIAANLARIFDIEFSVADDVDTSILYTFTSSRADLNQLLEELSYIAPISFFKKDGIIHIEAK